MTYVKGVWVDDDGSGTTGTTVSASRMNNIEQGVSDAHAGLAAIPLVSALPASPAAGQMVRLQAGSGAAAVDWLLAYKPNMADGSANAQGSKWNFLGGSDYYTDVVGMAYNNTVNSGYEQPSSSLQLTVPFAGTYDLDFMLSGQLIVAGVADVYAAVFRDATQITDGTIAFGRPNYQYDKYILSGRSRAALTAGQVLSVRGDVTAAAGSFQWAAGRIGMRPVRLT